MCVGGSGVGGVWFVWCMCVCVCGGGGVCRVVCNVCGVWCGVYRSEWKGEDTSV